MNNVTKILGSVAIAGVIAAGSSAFTAGGLTSTAGDAVSLGGTITQEINGDMTVTGIVYDYATDNSGLVEDIHVTFSTAPGVRPVTAVLNGDDVNPVTCGAGATAVERLCTPLAPLDLNTVAITVV